MIDVAAGLSTMGLVPFATSSAGHMTVMPGMVRMRAKSSQHWWDAPSSPTEMLRHR